MRNISLYKTLKVYCKAALEYFARKETISKEFLIGIKEKFEFTDDGGYSQPYVPEVRWFMLVVRDWKNLADMKTYKTASRELKEDTEIVKHLDTLVGTEESRFRIDTETCLRSLLTRLLEEQQNFVFQESVFNTVYGDFEDYFYRDKATYRCISTLNNFQAGIEKIELDPGFSIIKLSKEEKGEIMSQSRQPFGLSSYQLTPFNEYAFECYIQVPKVIGERQPIYKGRKIPSLVVRTKFEEACSALRLFKNGAVSHDNLVRMKSISWEPIGGISTTSSIVITPTFGAQYTLSKAEIPDFLKFWDFFQRTRRKSHKRIDVALRRFNFGYERVRPEDKLIDYLIGFEALLLKGQERGELEYRLALRGSVLLETTLDGKERTYEELKTAYRERSNIVHGGTIKETVKIGTDIIKLNEFIGTVEQHLRLAIKEFLRRIEIKSESSVINELDERIISGHI